VFNLNVVNVDGPYDGGTDFAAFANDGSRIDAAYQITTQKAEIRGKAYKDAKKTIDKLGASRFYFLTTLNLPEIEARKIESNITNELGIQAICFGARHIAGFLLEGSLLNQFLDKSGYPLPRGVAESPDYNEMVLHAYALVSRDAEDMRKGIYDDTILFILSGHEEIDEIQLISKVKEFLGVGENRNDLISRRINALFLRHIHRTPNKSIQLNHTALQEINLRKRVYEKELGDLAAAQIDLIRRDYNSDWSLEDSRTVSVYIADINISKQVEILRDIKAGITANSILNLGQGGIDRLKDYLRKKRIIPRKSLDEAIGKLVSIAATHPLIAKLARASVYVALEGASPIASAKALGAARWDDYRILTEPTVAIPWICSRLYRGTVNRYFDSAIRSLERAKELGVSLHITYFYINECAGHLLRARKYAGLEMDSKELSFSPNAFIANYYSLKNQGVKVPDKLQDYLCKFSSAMTNEMHDIRLWVRSIMTDIQTILTKSGIEFIEVPKYDHVQCSRFEKEYTYSMRKYFMDKPRHLIEHDVWALQFTNDLIVKDGEHWLILTYDKSIIDVGKSDIYTGWVTPPNYFLDLTEIDRPLSEAQYVSLVHSFASYSEKTLSAGARILDRIIQYASSQEMQNWQFLDDLREFKRNIFDKTNLDEPSWQRQIDAKTDEFLEAHGIKVSDRRLDEAEEVE